MRKLRERAPGWKPARGPHSAGPRGRAGRRLGAAAIVAALLGTAGWLLADRPAAPSHRAAAAQIRSLRPVREAAFGPRGEGDGDNPALARLAVGRAAGWHSHWYTTAAFGNLKPGTGLLLDMGHSVTITSAEVRLGSVPGADLQLRLGGMPMLADLLPVARAGNAGGEVRLKLARPARARYVLIWFTRLPPDSAGTFRASVSGVRVYGPG